MTVCLLSGGRDSVCLLDVLLARGEDVTALHVNYGLRDEADADEAFCRELCARLGVPLHVVRAGAPVGNVQAWAREVRYAAARELAGDGDIAVGHTATDQVETVLYRLAASPGRRALLGMRERDGQVVRPLLGMTREQTAAHCRARGLPWREDASNDSDTYARNRARAGLVPALRALHPAADANVLRTLETLRDEAEVLDALVADAARDRRVASLAALPPALRRLVLQRLVDDVGGPAAGARVDEVLALGGAGTKALDLGGGVRAVVEYGVLRVTREAPPAAPVAEVALPVPGRAAWGDGEVVAEGIPPTPPGLTLRAWRPGDRIRLGGGTRTLQDLFTDRKVPRERRARTPVVLCGGEIAWVGGVATAEGFGALRLTWRQ